MRLALQIRYKGDTLVDAFVDTAFDATGTEAGNHLRQCVLDAIPGDEADPRHDQFLIGTAVCEWATGAFRTGRHQVATVPLSEGRPCTTVSFGPEHVRLDPEEAVIVLLACPDDMDSERLLETRRTIRKAA